ncbi:hypothetical protein TSAR_001984 [Trichomalopsis sarcophagae]|uniref:Uncharacterized protein n=1 Tax=Trichomalopsis sarcophagae TaxID=543379 RepID=A0A232ELE3_9HYME|nr:hypothetical protein TSAR_001984 [Trichomalopsis sarcophagae]
MEHARKMIIVPEVMAERLQNITQPSSVHPQQQQQQPLSPPLPAEGSVQTPRDNLSRLDTEMYEILNSKKFTNEDEKCENYLQTLRRFLFLKQIEEPRDENLATPLSEETIIENGSLVPQSNIADLLSDVLVKEKKGDQYEPPAGQFQFAKFIARSETPDEFVINTNVAKMIRQILTRIKAGKRKSAAQ